jgi:hypothetical protein
LSQDSVFKLDRKFIKQLRDRLLKPNQFGFRFEPSEIPTIEQLDRIISVMIWASSKHEEGRLSRFRVAFGEPLILDHLALEFEVHKAWSVKEVQKLAPALVPLEGHIGVWPTEAGELQIWGVLTNSLLQLTFEVIDPGRITVTMLPNQKVCEIAGERSGFISSSWNSSAFDLLSPPTSNIEKTTYALATSSFSLHATQEMLRQMRLLGHGGTVVFVTDRNRWKRFVEPPVYSCSQPLNKMLPLMEQFRKEVLKISGDEKSFDQDKIKQAFELFNERYKPWVNDAARSIASLTAIDGATLLTVNFEVLGFGVKLKGSQKGGADEMVTSISPLDDPSMSSVEIPIDEEFRGTRHSSAARFVLKNSGSVALVVSQDGGITGVVGRTNKDTPPMQKVYAYKSLELLI